MYIISSFGRGYWSLKFMSARSSENKSSEKTLFIKTWGCQMNVYDSNRMADVLRPLGYRTVDSPEGADMMILNTCHIREKATEKVFSELGRLKEHKDKKTGALLAVAGCVAQAEGELITDRAPYVDMVFGPQTYHELPEMVARATNAYGSERVIHTEFPAHSKFDFLPEEHGEQGVSAFLSVQEGCDKFCTFCVVPYTRGSEFSRPVADVLREAQRLVGAGVREITLLGQNVNAYHGDGPDGTPVSLGFLIRKLAEMDGLDRIRYTTSHPRDMDPDLIAAHGDTPKLMPFLHLPVQSGSDRILKVMNRKHTAEDFVRIVEDLRNAKPGLALSSDFIVGFPGETEEDFLQTMDLVEKIGFVSAYSFKYSARPGTPAANMGGLVREEIKTERLQRLQALLEAQQIAFNESMVGQTLPVLFDRKPSPDAPLFGRTPYSQAVHIAPNPGLQGRIANLTITEASRNSLTGEVCTSPS